MQRKPRAPAPPSELEQDYQNAFMIALSATGRVHVHRQPAGAIPAARGGVVKCAPVGSADVTGGVTEPGPCWGVRLELEVKGPLTPHTDEQKQWAAKCAEWGFIHLLLRARRGEALDAFAARATAEVLAAIDARAAGALGAR